MKRRILLAIAVCGVGLVVAIVLFMTRDDTHDAVARARPTSSASLANRSDRTRTRPPDRESTADTTGSGGAGTASVAELVMAHAGGAVLAAAPAYAYIVRTDASGVLAVEVPTSWADVQTAGIAGDDGATYPQIVAARNVAAYLQGYDAPGESVTVDASGATTAGDWLTSSDLSADCASDGRVPFEDGVFQGVLQVWHTCRVALGVVAVVAVTPTGNPLSLRIVVQAATTADLAVIDHALKTFTVDTK
jgi:hypothetical protein